MKRSNFWRLYAAIAAYVVLCCFMYGCANNSGKIINPTSMPAGGEIRTDQTTGTVAVDLDKLAVKIQDLVKAEIESLVKITTDLKATAMEIHKTTTENVGGDQVKEAGASAAGPNAKAVTFSGDGLLLLILNIAVVLLLAVTVIVIVYLRSKNVKLREQQSQTADTLTRLMVSLEESDARNESAAEAKSRFDKRIIRTPLAPLVEQLLDDLVRK